MLIRITDLFVGASDRFSEEQIDLFDAVMSLLAASIDASERAMLARRLVPLRKVPSKLGHQLAAEDDIRVAGSILSIADWMDDQVLMHLVQVKGQQHLCAIAQRKSLSEGIVAALIERAGDGALRALADNHEIAFSEMTFAKLIDRCADNDELAASVGSRPDIPHEMFKRLLGESSEVVRSKFIEANLPVRIEFSSVEPHFIFIDTGRPLLAA